PATEDAVGEGARLEPHGMADLDITDLALRHANADEQLASVSHPADLGALLEVLPDHARQVFAEERARPRRRQLELGLLALEQVAAPFERGDELARGGELAAELVDLEALGADVRAGQVHLRGRARVLTPVLNEGGFEPLACAGEFNRQSRGSRLGGVQLAP